MKKPSERLKGRLVRSIETLEGCRNECEVLDKFNEIRKNFDDLEYHFFLRNNRR